MSGILASFSELDTFRQCPAKHQMAYKERWTAPTKSPALIKGTDLHKVLEVHYNTLQGWQETGEVPSMAVLEPAIKGILATCDPDHRDLVEWMYTGYLEQYGFEQEWGWKILAVERSYEVPLPHPEGKRSSIRLKLKIDIVVKDPMGRIWVVDNKSGRNLPKDKELDIDDQFGLYVWAMRLMGKNVFGAVHNAVRSERLQRPMTMEERFKRTRMHRTDGELEVLAREAYSTLETAWRHYRPGRGDAPRAPDSDRCKWRCDFTDACLLSRKQGKSMSEVMVQFGFKQDFRRH